MTDIILPLAYRSLPSEDLNTIQRIINRLLDYGNDADQMEHILHSLVASLADCADPALGMISFERYLNRLDDPAGILNVLRNNPRSIDILAKVFSSSRFLTEILIRNASVLINLAEYRQLSKPKSHDQLYNEALSVVQSLSGYENRIDALRKYQSGELLRIGASDLLDFYDLWAVTRQLSNLADALIRVCLRTAGEEIAMDPRTLTVLGMGKLGGRELNYSSDIDLIFLTDSDPAEAEKFGKKLIDALDRVTPNGFLYRVDMRLRPWGRVGPLVSSVTSHMNYLKVNARHWEKQALLKCRVLAGNMDVGRTFLDQIKPYLTGGAFPELQQAVREMRQMTVSHLQKSGIEWGEVKQGHGSIRDVEFTIQFLQLAYGSVNPNILFPNTMDAMNRLFNAGILNIDEYRTLKEGYVFQRTIEHFLQIMDYRQIHQLPSDPQALDALALRLGFSGEKPGQKLVQRYEQHVEAIHALFMKYLGENSTISTLHNQKPKQIELTDPLSQHLNRMTTTYSELFSPEEINQHAEAAAELSSDQPVVVLTSMLDTPVWKVSVIAYDFPGELSVITGLLFVYGLDILNGEAFTYQQASGLASRRSARRDGRKKIVDVFTVQPFEEQTITKELWAGFQADLTRFHHLVIQNRFPELQREITKRFAAGMQKLEQNKDQQIIPTLYPIQLDVDNDSSPDFTVLRINALDTTGFLFEFTNALAMNGIYIDRVIIETIGNHVQDILFVTDANGRKILDAKRQQEMKTATLLIKQFSHLLPYSPNPETALIHFRDFIEQLFHRHNWPEELLSIQHPKFMHAMAKVLGVSDFLWEDFLRMQYSNLFPVVTDINALETNKDREQLEDELSLVLAKIQSQPEASGQFEAWVDEMTAWRDREMLRIDMRHILGHTQEFWDFASELTALAEVIVNAVFHHCFEDLRYLYGIPQKENGDSSMMSVLALGKFGGQELGFASDIELMFVYEKNGSTTGPQIISTAEFYEKLVENFSKSMRARREGIFQLDLQLRPYGKTGNLAVSLDSFKRYFKPGGPAWSYERQSLVKLRPVAGDDSLGRKITELRDEFVYSGQSFDAISMRAMRERQIRHLVKAGVYNLKYSLGGLVDVEYLIQGLQMANGQTYPQVRGTNTRAAMAKLAEAGFLSEEDYTHLRKAHTFLRWMIDSLRMVRGNAKDVTVPAEGSEEMAYLARRMRYGNDTAALQTDLLLHQSHVQEINSRLLR